MSKKTLLVSYALFSCSLAWAQPSLPQVVQGEAHFHSVDSQTLEVQAAHLTKINWNDFSIGQGETTRFVQPHASSVVINQVTGLKGSDIFGTLSANGHVYLINPHGIYIGPDAFIQTAGFMATTLDQLTLDKDGIPIHFKGDSQATLTHLGQIETAGGSVTLVAAHVNNFGSIQGQDVTVVSAPEVWIKPNEKGVYLIPQVSLQEIEASTDPMEFVIKQEGVIRATGFAEREGHIYLVSSQTTHLNGTLESQNVDVWGDQIVLGEKAHIDVSHTEKAGSVRVGGDYQGKNPEVPNASHTTIQKGAVILANGLEGGDGGRVILWGNKSCDFQGSIEGRGGQSYGDGGFVEISSPLALHFHGLVNLLAPQGKTGMLLLDPIFLTVDGNATNLVPTPCPISYTGNAIGGIVNNIDLSLALNGCDVTLQTTGGGDIAINERLLGLLPGQWTGPTTLFINSAGNVRWEWVTGSSAVITTEVPQGSLNISAVGDITFGIQSGNSNIDNGFWTGSGDITLNAGGTVHFNAGGLADTNNTVALMSETGTTQITANALNMQALGNDGSNTVGIGFTNALVTGPLGTTLNNPMTFTIANDVTLNAVNANLSIGYNVLCSQFPNGISGPITFNNIGGQLNAQVNGPLTTFGGLLHIGHTLNNITAGVGPAVLTNCDITFNNIGSDVVLTSIDGFLQIGHQIIAPTYNVNGAIQFDRVGGNITMNQSSVTLIPFIANEILVGHANNAGNSPASPFIIEGPISIGAVTPVQGALLLSTTFGPVTIGHFGGLSSFSANGDVIVRGDISVNVAGGAPSITIQSGTPIGAFAGIGHSTNNQGTGASTITVGPTAMNIIAQNGISLLSPSTNASYIGYYDPLSAPRVQDITINPLNITTGTGQPITLSGGLALIGTTNTTGSIVCPINILGNPNLQLIAPTPAGFAQIVNNRMGEATSSDITINTQSIGLNTGIGRCLISSGQNLNATATESVSVNGISLVTAVGNQTTIAGQNISVTNFGRMTTTQGDLNLVVDNLFPTPLLFGPGMFNLGSTSLLTSGGTLRIYTSLQSLNTVAGLINGQSFTPGPVFVNTALEQWETYYPFAAKGVPFTIFYKNVFVPVAFVERQIPKYLSAQREYLQDMQRFDDLVLTENIFTVDSDVRFQKGLDKWKQLIRVRRDFHVKWLEPTTFLGQE